MSRAKRTRKARMAARAARRLATLDRRFEAAVSAYRERARFRAELNASDAPDAVKTVLGVLVDPVGFALDAFAAEVTFGNKAP